MASKRKTPAYLWYNLGSLLILVGFSILFSIFFPLYYNSKSSEALSSPQKTFLKDSISNDQNFNLVSDRDKQKEENNNLVIPSAKIDIPLIQSESSEALSRGAWIYPFSALPGEEGNTVVSAHRFQFKTHRSNSFYSIHKVKTGDEININWDNKTYTYIVKEIFEVEPHETEILRKGNEEKLTLYTCTPLFTTLKRLVIIALPKDTQ